MQHNSDSDSDNILDDNPADNNIANVNNVNECKETLLEHIHGDQQTEEAATADEESSEKDTNTLHTPKRLAPFFNISLKFKHRYAALSHYLQTTGSTTATAKNAQVFRDFHQDISMFTFESFAIFKERLVQDGGFRERWVKAIGEWERNDTGLASFEGSGGSSGSCELKTLALMRALIFHAHRQHQQEQQEAEQSHKDSTLFSLSPAVQKQFLAILGELLLLPNVPYVMQREAFGVLLQWLCVCEAEGDVFKGLEGLFCGSFSLHSEQQCVRAGTTTHCNEEGHEDNGTFSSNRIHATSTPFALTPTEKQQIKHKNKQHEGALFAIDTTPQTQHRTHLLAHTLQTITFNKDADRRVTTLLYTLLSKHILQPLYTVDGPEESKGAGEEDVSLPPPLPLHTLLQQYIAFWTTLEDTPSGKTSTLFLHSPVTPASTLPIAALLLQEIVLSTPQSLQTIHSLLAHSLTLGWEEGEEAIGCALGVMRSWVFRRRERRPVHMREDNHDIRLALTLHLSASSSQCDDDSDDSDGSDGGALVDNLQYYLCKYIEMTTLLLLPRPTHSTQQSRIYTQLLYFYRALALQSYVCLEEPSWQCLIAALLRLIESQFCGSAPWVVGDGGDGDALCRLGVETLLVSWMRCPLSTATAGQQSTAATGWWQRISSTLQSCMHSGWTVVAQEWALIFTNITNVMIHEQHYANPACTHDAVDVDGGGLRSGTFEGAMVDYIYDGTMANSNAELGHPADSLTKFSTSNSAMMQAMETPLMQAIKNVIACNNNNVHDPSAICLSGNGSDSHDQFMQWMGCENVCEKAEHSWHLWFNVLGLLCGGSRECSVDANDSIQYTSKLTVLACLVSVQETLLALRTQTPPANVPVWAFIDVLLGEAVVDCDGGGSGSVASTTTAASESASALSVACRQLACSAVCRLICKYVSEGCIREGEREAAGNDKNGVSADGKTVDKAEDNRGFGTDTCAAEITQTHLHTLYTIIITTLKDRHDPCTPLIIAQTSTLPLHKHTILLHSLMKAVQGMVSGCESELLVPCLRIVGVGVGGVVGVYGCESEMRIPKLGGGGFTFSGAKSKSGWGGSVDSLGTAVDTVGIPELLTILEHVFERMVERRDWIAAANDANSNAGGMAGDRGMVNVKAYAYATIYTLLTTLMLPYQQHLQLQKSSNREQTEPPFIAHDTCITLINLLCDQLKAHCTHLNAGVGDAAGLLACIGSLLDVFRDLGAFFAEDLNAYRLVIMERVWMLCRNQIGSIASSPTAASSCGRTVLNRLLVLLLDYCIHSSSGGGDGNYTEAFRALLADAEAITPACVHSCTLQLKQYSCALTNVGGHGGARWPLPHGAHYTDAIIHEQDYLSACASTNVVEQSVFWMGVSGGKCVVSVGDGWVIVRNGLGKWSWTFKEQFGCIPSIQEGEDAVPISTDCPAPSGADPDAEDEESSENDVLTAFLKQFDVYNVHSDDDAGSVSSGSGDAVDFDANPFEEGGDGIIDKAAIGPIHARWLHARKLLYQLGIISATTPLTLLSPSPELSRDLRGVDALTSRQQMCASILCIPPGCSHSEECILGCGLDGVSSAYTAFTRSLGWRVPLIDGSGGVWSGGLEAGESRDGCVLYWCDWDMECVFHESHMIVANDHYCSSNNNAATTAANSGTSAAPSASSNNNNCTPAAAKSALVGTRKKYIANNPILIIWNESNRHLAQPGAVLATSNHTHVLTIAPNTTATLFLLSLHRKRGAKLVVADGLWVNASILADTIKSMIKRLSPHPFTDDHLFASDGNKDQDERLSEGDRVARRERDLKVVVGRHGVACGQSELAASCFLGALLPALP